MATKYRIANVMLWREGASLLAEFDLQRLDDKGQAVSTKHIGPVAIGASPDSNRIVESIACVARTAARDDALSSDLLAEAKQKAEGMEVAA
jgi:hypothetical protein